jgi:hypothetical protein
MPLKTVFGAARERLKHLAAMLKTSIALAHRLLLLLQRRPAFADSRWNGYSGALRSDVTDP